ncbi:MAG TPA: acyltransferase family protein [Acidimicrobiales bacterium]|nr:acyltransferase family protein [Acidimicrobiales bacterium]
MTYTARDASVVDPGGPGGPGGPGNGNGDDRGPGRRDDPASDASGDAEARTGRRHLTYNPALDGIRGLAVGAVLLFHGGFSWARGGFLGVSTFFTLSGFLITSLLVVEFGRNRRVKLTAFWARRLRRLLPASAVTLALLLLSLVVLNESWEPTLPGDVIACVLNVANWRFLFADRSYAELFASPSPALHFWSLAIEEQFYWVFPLLTAGVLVAARGSLRIYAAVLAGFLVLSGVLTLAYRDTPNTVYYSTPIRMGEILVGALLAVALAEGRMAGLKRWAPLLGLVGAVALAASGWAWWNLEQDTPSLYKGGLLVYALVSGALVLSACVEGPVKRLLSFEPLRLLGVVSYGVYLFHWPLFLLLDEARVDGWLDPFNLHLRGTSLFALRIAVTLVAAIVSYRFLEQPIRNGQRPRLTKAPLMAAGTVAAIVVAALVIPKVWEPPLNDFEKIAAAQERIQSRIDAVPTSVPRVMFFGDSTAMMASGGVGAWGLDSGELVVPDHATELGCSIGRGGERRQYGEESTIPAGCDWSVTWAAALDRHPETKVAVVMTGTWDVIDRKIPGDAVWRGPGDPLYDQFLSSEIGSAMDLLRSRNVTVVWLTTPPLDFGRGKTPRPELDPADAAARVDRLNQLIRDRAALYSDGVGVVEFGDYIAGLPPDEDARIRSDGVHLNMADSEGVAEDWLGPEILRVAVAAGAVL